ncbi:MAG: hypothetical protein KA144_02175 [Xanthomonadaceae bacterium]|nr:hypothetical protein [Xanthomonadaceae bacterium]MBP7622450.1 hypothetical protein [Xanthomonadales bacterium]
MSQRNANQGRVGLSAAPLHPAADRALIRLDLLRLAHRHDFDAKQVIERAQALEAYVFDDQTADKAKF